MNRTICGTLAAAQLMAPWFAFAETSATSPPRTDQVAGSSQPGAVLAVSPSQLQFGLVGVGRTRELKLRVQNVGDDKLVGSATVAAPFTITGHKYSLGSGQSKVFTVWYRPTAEGTNSQLVVFSGERAVTVPVIGMARTPPPPPGKLKLTSRAARFAEEDAADFIAQYFSDETSYALKPAMMDGAFQSVCTRAALLKLAGQQPRHDLAVVVLNHYPNPADEDAAEVAWVKDLKSLGYQRIVFLRGNNTTRVNGLPILDYPQASTLSASR